MATAFARRFMLDLFLLSLLIRSGVCQDPSIDKDKLLALGNTLVNDAAQKGESVWIYRIVYQRYVSFAIGERIYIIRAKFAQMLRTYLRSQLTPKDTAVRDLVRTALMLQKKAQAMYNFKDELVEFDYELSTAENPQNVTRFGPMPCQVAGPPCDIMNTIYGYRRSASSKKFGTSDQALKLLDGRRADLAKIYQNKITRPPLDIHAALNRTLSLTINTLSEFHNDERNYDFLNLAPDL